MDKNTHKFRHTLLFVFERSNGGLHTIKILLPRLNSNVISLWCRLTKKNIVPRSSVFLQKRYKRRERSGLYKRKCFINFIVGFNI